LFILTFLEPRHVHPLAIFAQVGEHIVGNLQKRIFMLT